MLQELWEQVQRGLRDHLGAARTKRTRQSSDALLAGKLYDVSAGDFARRQKQSGIDRAFQPPMSKLSWRRLLGKLSPAASVEKILFELSVTH